MGWISGVVVFLLIWWTVLFAVLPWGNRPPETPQTGHMSGAPANPRIKAKFLVTTAIAACIWLVIYVLIDIRIVDFHQAARDMMQEDLSR